MPEVFSQEEKATTQQEAVVMIDSSEDSDSDNVQVKVQ